MCDGREDKVFEFLRSLQSSGRQCRDVLIEVLRILDEVHQQRLEGGRIANTSVSERVAKFSNSDIEELIQLLTRGVDYSYQESYMGTKMAFVRALDYLKRR